MKRKVSFLLVFALLLSMVSAIPYQAKAEEHEGRWEWRWPVPSSNQLSSCYGEKRGSRTHDALDIVGSNGCEIYATFPGTVIKTFDSCDQNYRKDMNNSCPCGRCGGLGNSVTIRHEYNGKVYESRYGHLSKVSVSVGQTVTMDTVIGLMGCTGISTGTHLDFKITCNGNPVDPMLSYLVQRPAGLNAGGASAASTCCPIYASKVNALPDLHTHNFAYDLKNEKCSCGQKFEPTVVKYSGTAKLKSTVNIKDVPYKDIGKNVKKVSSGKKVTVLSSRTNVYGNVWYKVTYSETKWFKTTKYTGYIHADRLDLSGAKAEVKKTSIKINFTFPAENANIERKPQSIEGSVTTTGSSLTEVSAYLDGTYFATDSSASSSLNLWGSNIDWACPFGSMSNGAHTIKIVAKDNTGNVAELERHFTVGNVPAPPAIQPPVTPPVVAAPTFNVSVDWPTEGAQVKRAPQSIVGCVTVSSGSINKIDMYIDGALYASQSGITESSFNLWGSTFDWSLPFGSLGIGNHALTFIITDTSGGTHSFTRNFTTVW